MRKRHHPDDSSKSPPKKSPGLESSSRGFRDFSLVDKFSCSDCKMEYSTAEHLSRHRLYAHQVFTCDLCSTEFPTSKHDEYDAHLADAHSFFNHESDEQQNCLEEQTHEQQNQLKCKVCDEEFGEEFQLQAHHHQSHLKTSRRSKTPVAATDSSGKRKLKKQTTLTEQADDPQRHQFKCKVCDKKFREEFHLQAHQCPSNVKKSRRKKTSAGPSESLEHGIECAVCHSTFTTTEDLQQHLKSHQFSSFYPNVPTTHVCPLCNWRCFDSNLLESHVSKCFMYRARAQCILQCNVCKRSFANFADLEKHESVHATDVGMSMFSCALCDHKCSQLAILDLHISLAHPMKCPDCDKPFRRADQLSRHQALNHSDNAKNKKSPNCPVSKREKCEICGKMFRDLLLHQRRWHTKAELESLQSNLIMFVSECDQCGYRCNDLETLNSHISVNHAPSIRNDGEGEAFPDSLQLQNPKDQREKTGTWTESAICKVKIERDEEDTTESIEMAEKSCGGLENPDWSIKLEVPSDFDDSL